MRLLRLEKGGEFSLVEFVGMNIPLVDEEVNLVVPRQTFYKY